jgi:hypothetical protein
VRAAPRVALLYNILFCGAQDLVADTFPRWWLVVCAVVFPKAVTLAALLLLWSFNRTLALVLLLRVTGQCIDDLRLNMKHWRAEGWRATWARYGFQRPAYLACVCWVARQSADCVFVGGWGGVRGTLGSRPTWPSCGRPPFLWLSLWGLPPSLLSVFRHCQWWAKCSLRNAVVSTPAVLVLFATFPLTPFMLSDAVFYCALCGFAVWPVVGPIVPHNQAGFARIMRGLRA